MVAWPLYTKVAFGVKRCSLLNTLSIYLLDAMNPKSVYLVVSGTSSAGSLCKLQQRLLFVAGL